MSTRTVGKRRSARVLLALLAGISTALVPALGFAADPTIPPGTKVRGRPIVYIQVPGHSVPVVDGEFAVQLFKESDLKAVLASEPFKSRGAKAVALGQDPYRIHDLAFYRMDFPTGLDMKTIQSQIKQNRLVKRSDPNVIAFLAYTPGDSGFSYQWGLDNDGSTGGTADADIDAPEAWNVETGASGVDVFVVDTGIPMSGGSLSHPDLDSSLVTPTFNVVTWGADPADDYGHGTHVAGIIAAEMDNPEGGTVGVCPGCMLRIVKAFDSRGGSTLTDEMIATQIPATYAWYYGRPTVVNMSWKLADGYESTGTAAFESIIDWVHTTKALTNILFVVAAGNDGGPVSYPAAYSATHTEVIAVAATDYDDQPASYSNVGPEVTVAAPGTDVYSTTPDYAVGGGGCTPAPALNYDTMSGTSMAAPHVAGLAGLLWSADPTFTSTEVRAFIMDGADEVGPYAYAAGRNDYMGDGRINACQSLREAGVATLMDCLNVVVAPHKVGAARQVRGRGLKLAAFFAPYAIPMIAIGGLRRKAKRA